MIYKLHTIYTRSCKTIIYVGITSYTTKTGWADTGKTVNFVYTCTFKNKKKKQTDKHKQREGN